MLMQPPLALGQVVHEVVESLSRLPVDQRVFGQLMDHFYSSWRSVAGDLGGFASREEEEKYKSRGASMIRRIMEHPGRLRNKAIKLRQELPYFWLSEENNIILCGKIDWLEYKEDTDSVHIIDFKTGKFDEDPDSLQLPIYLLLVTACQSRPVSGASYWYLDRDDEPTDVPLPNPEASRTRLLEIANKIHLARKLEHFRCPQKEGCRVCRPYESIINGEATFIAVGSYSQDIYTLTKRT